MGGMTTVTSGDSFPLAAGTFSSSQDRSYGLRRKKQNIYLQNFFPTSLIPGLQWNSSNPYTNGTEESVHISEMSSFQGLNYMQEPFSWNEKVERCPHFRGVLRKMLHYYTKIQYSLTAVSFTQTSIRRLGFSICSAVEMSSPSMNGTSVTSVTHTFRQATHAALT